MSLEFQENVPHNNNNNNINHHYNNNTSLNINGTSHNENHNRYRNISTSNSHNSSPHGVTNILNVNLNSYSHTAQPIPPYVLDRVAQVHFKDDGETNNMKDSSNDLMKSDPFLDALDNNWRNFVTTMQNPIIYSNGNVQYDSNAMNRHPDLSGSWGGDERLRNALASDEEKTSTYGTDDGILTRIFFLGGRKRVPNKTSKDSKDKKSEKNPRVRSKAGYWMSDEKRADLKPTLQRIFLNNPYIPLTLRSIIFILSIIALGLACSIFVFSRRRYDGHTIDQQPSTIMAICVQSCALVYLIYITYDEYSGKPIGLRDPLSKMRLILLDLLFIIFSSANLSLTFNTLFDDRWVCKGSPNTAYPNVAPMCKRQRGLATFLFLVLIMWVITFTVSIIRIVERVAPGGHG